MNHYEALGVAKNATPDEIKQAYRKMSKKHHPDRKGGDSRAMVRINQAYDCLSDPRKREYYDLHDEQDEPKRGGIEQQALSVIYGILATLSEQTDGEGDFVTAVVENLRENVSGLDKQRPKIERQIAKAERQRKCIRRKHSKENLLDRVFQQKIDALKAKLLELPEAIEIGRKALEIMADYENAFSGHYPPAERYAGGLSGLINDEMARALFGGRR